MSNVKSRPQRLNMKINKIFVVLTIYFCVYNAFCEKSKNKISEEFMNNIRKITICREKYIGDLFSNESKLILTPLFEITDAIIISNLLGIVTSSYKTNKVSISDLPFSGISSYQILEDENNKLVCLHTITSDDGFVGVNQAQKENDVYTIMDMEEPIFFTNRLYCVSIQNLFNAHILVKEADIKIRP